MHQSSMAQMEQFVDRHLTDRRGRPTNVLDLGAMDVNGSYRVYFDDPAWTYRGADASPGPGVDLVLSDPYDWRTVPSGSVDVLVTGQTFEHVRFPWASILEVRRVLRPGGLLCLLVPAGGYQHRYPVDCWRYYPDGVAALAAWADLEVLEAATSWTPEGEWTDDSAVWQDTRLVARRPVLHGRHRVQNELKHAALRRLTGAHALRQEGRTAVLGPSDDERT